jgi:hypothetical protein
VQIPATHLEESREIAEVRPILATGQEERASTSIVSLDTSSLKVVAGQDVHLSSSQNDDDPPLAVVSENVGPSASSANLGTVSTAADSNLETLILVTDASQMIVADSSRVAVAPAPIGSQESRDPVIRQEAVTLPAAAVVSHSVDGGSASQEMTASRLPTTNKGPGPKKRKRSIPRDPSAPKKPGRWATSVKHLA